MHNKFVKRSFLYVLFIFVLLISTIIKASDLKEEFKATSPHPLLASTVYEAFKRNLQDMAESLTDSYNHFPKIFVCYSSDGKFHRQCVKALGKDLKTAGIPQKKILLDVQANPPGSGIEILNYIKQIETAPKVIVIGSSSLKEKYEKHKDKPLEDYKDNSLKEMPGFYTAQELKLLIKRGKANGWNGIIPVWFQGTYTENFPEDLPDIPRCDLSNNYDKYFFTLLTSLFRGIPALKAENSLIAPHYRKYEESLLLIMNGSTHQNTDIDPHYNKPLSLLLLKKTQISTDTNNEKREKQSRSARRFNYYFNNSKVLAGAFIFLILSVCLLNPLLSLSISSLFSSQPHMHENAYESIMKPEYISQASNKLSDIEIPSFQPESTNMISQEKIREKDKKKDRTDTINKSNEINLKLLPSISLKQSGQHKEVFITDQDIRKYLSLAEQGDVDAQFNLGAIYENGQGVYQDYAQAVAWYQQAANQGYGPAQINLGSMYMNGIGVQQDDKEAVKWYTKAAARGIAKGSVNLGLMYLFGRGVPQNNIEAVRWFYKAAEHGEASGQYNLGEMYLLGRGVIQSDIEAVRWYRESAAQDYAYAQFKMGVMCEKGQGGMVQDDVETVKWYTKAAEQGYALALSNLGAMYAIGRGGLPQDYSLAVQLFLAAAEQGEEYGQYNLGEMYAKGRGVDRNYIEAVKWWLKAAEQGHSHAQFKLGTIFEKGQKGILINDSEAIKWYTKAAEQGHIEAQFKLGEAYANGQGDVVQDDGEAIKWYLKAVEQNHAKAQLALGIMYEEGKGVERDEVEALRLYNLAAGQGNREARFRINMINQRLP